MCGSKMEIRYGSLFVWIFQLVDWLICLASPLRKLKGAVMFPVGSVDSWLLELNRTWFWRVFLMMMFLSLSLFLIRLVVCYIKQLDVRKRRFSLGSSMKKQQIRSICWMSLTAMERRGALSTVGCCWWWWVFLPALSNACCQWPPAFLPVALWRLVCLSADIEILIRGCSLIRSALHEWWIYCWAVGMENFHRLLFQSNTEEPVPWWALGPEWGFCSSLW